MKDRDEVGYGGITIKARMQSLCEKAADNIKECGNACDAYARKRLLSKVVNGHIWQEKLTRFARAFLQCKADFQQALAIHTARAVDATQVVVNATHAEVAAMRQQYVLGVRIGTTERWLTDL